MCFLWLSTRQPPEPEQQQPVSVKEPADPLLRSSKQTDPQSDVDSDKPEASGDDFASVPNHPSQVVTLGTMNAADGYNLLVFINSEGASVERVELIEQEKPGNYRFRALEHDSAYLGYLAPRETSGGVTVRVVPPGSPANLAKGGPGGGIEAGDIITEVAGRPTLTPDALEHALDGFKAGSTVEVKVDRGGKSLVFSVTTCEPPLDLVRTSPWDTEEVTGNDVRRALITTIGSINGTNIPEGEYSLPALAGIETQSWEVKPLDVSQGQGVEFRLALDSFLAGSGRPAKLDLVKRYRLLKPDEDDSEKDGYLLDLETLIENRNDAEVNVSLRQEGIPGLTLEGWWYSVKISPHMFSGAGNRDVLYKSKAAGHQIATTREIQKNAVKEPRQPDIVLFSSGEPIENRSLEYIGTDAQYFNASILPHPNAPESLTDLRRAAAVAVADAPKIASSQAQATNTSFWFDTLEVPLASGESFSQRYLVYLGPKETASLADHNLEEAIEYGWFGWIAKPLGWILHFFHGIVQNYGMAIVLLTVLVRGSMFPLSRKAAINAQQMQQLQPELKKINDKYKDNMEKRTKAMQELYAKHNFKPLASCLPMFFQLPIFLGLYRCLSVDIALRQQPLIPGVQWCSNLAAPDQIANWSSWMPEIIAGRGTGWLGPYFNLLPILTVVLFIVQQKILMPKATDEQTRMTQNMMQFMTLFMGVLFFKVPAGLCIYFITSSLWSLVERKLVKRLTPPPKELPTTPSDDADKPRSGKKKPVDRKAGDAPQQSGGKLQELMKMLEKPGQTSATHRGTNKQKNKKDSPPGNRPPPPKRPGKKRRK